MKIADVMTALQTFLSGLSWTSDEGGGATTLEDKVFTFKNWNYNEGWPFVVLDDGLGDGNTISNRDFNFETTLSISICVNWGIIDKQDDDLKKEEAMLRIREAWDYIKTQLFLVSTVDTIGVDWSKDPAFADDEIIEYNLFRRNITLVIKENISRG